jgi:hypothetical protein
MTKYLRESILLEEGFIWAQSDRTFNPSLQSLRSQQLIIRQPERREKECLH